MKIGINKPIVRPEPPRNVFTIVVESVHGDDVTRTTQTAVFRDITNTEKMLDLLIHMAKCIYTHKTVEQTKDSVKQAAEELFGESLCVETIDNTRYADDLVKEMVTLDVTDDYDSFAFPEYAEVVYYDHEGQQWSCKLFDDKGKEVSKLSFVKMFY